MKKSTYLIIALFLTSLFAQVRLVADEPGKEVALVTSVSGAVTLRTGEAEAALKIGTRLRTGDVVNVKEGSAALVFLTGEYLALSAGESLTVGEDRASCTISSGAATRGLGPDDGMTVAADGVDAGQDDDFWQSQLASVSGIRADAEVIAVSPRLTVSDPNPLFCWFDTDTTAGPVERSYTLILRDAHYETIAERTVRGKTGMLATFRFEQMPKGFEAAARKHYSWTILPEGGQPKKGILDAVFVYVDDGGLADAHAHAAGLQRMLELGSIDETSFHMLLSRYYLDERERLFADAIPHLRILASTDAGSAYARQELAHMFLRFGNQVSTLAPRILTPTVRLGSE
ncbi:hypothetical protein KQI65_09620 [bacterium]|nr:hypothetical protein [bacterium]